MVPAISLWSRRKIRVNSRAILLNREVKSRRKHGFPRFVADPKPDPALKRAMFCWKIYKFPVRYKSRQEEKEALGLIRCIVDLYEEEYRGMVEKVRLVFNAKQDCWVVWKLRFSPIQDVISRLRT